MPASPRFWNWIAKRYARQPIADEAAYRHKLDVTRGYLRPDMQVLEFGSGTGSTALTHAPHVGQITGIDFSPKMTAIARAKAEAAGIANARFDVSTIEAWAAPDASYDLILGMSILHLLEDRARVLAKVRRLLKPGGLFISSTACAADANLALRLVLPVGTALGVLPLVRFFSKDTLIAEHVQAGFSLEHDWQPGPGKAFFLVARAA
jgi:ubiquinone/menaquinone biosynthesis C-methylase UbiE